MCIRDRYFDDGAGAGAAAGSGDGVSWATFSRGASTTGAMGAGGGVDSIGGVKPGITTRTGAGGGVAGAGVCAASSRRINSLTMSDESSPHFWQTKRIGFCAISGETSKAYFVPHEHWIFMAPL